MPKMVQVRDVPDDLHDALVRQAKDQGKSLNQFLLVEYARIARRGDNRQLFDALASVQGARPTREQLVEQIQRDRSRDS